MNLDRNTKLKDLMDAHPWLLDEAEKLDAKFKMLNNPLGKAFLKHATIDDLSKKSGLTVDQIVGWLKQIIDGHK